MSKAAHLATAALVGAGVVLAIGAAHSGPGPYGVACLQYSCVTYDTRTGKQLGTVWYPKDARRLFGSTTSFDKP